MAKEQVDIKKLDRLDTSRELADLMLASDKALEVFYQRSVGCTIAVVASVAGLVIDLIFLTLDSVLGSVLYYSSLVALLGVLVLYLFYYYQYMRTNANIQDRLTEARARLNEQQELDKLKDKIRARIDRMKGEVNWFTHILEPGVLESLDKGRPTERGNEEFEYFIRKFFEKMGFKLERSAVLTESGSHMQMAKDDKQYLIYPVHPPAPISEEFVRNVNRELMQSSVKMAIIITAGSFTEKAREYCSSRDSKLLLYDRRMVEEGVRAIIGALRSRVSEENNLLTESNTERFMRAFKDKGEEL